MNITIYVRSGPIQIIFNDIKCLTTEGNLVRIVDHEGKSTWFPITEVFKIVQQKETLK